VTSGGAPHLGGVALWGLDDFRKWAQTALSTVRRLRRRFSEPGDLYWRDEAAEAFKRNGLDARVLYESLTARKAKALLKVAKP
jgi:hypothetical protein